MMPDKKPSSPIRGNSGTPRALLFAFAFLLFAASFGVGSSRAQGTYYGRTTDPTPVELTLQDINSVVTFVIPKVYLTFSENWKGGPQTIIVIETIFPSMAPLSASRNNMLGPDVLTIRAKSHASTGAKYSVRQALQWRKSNQWALVDSFSDSKSEKVLVYVNKNDVAKHASKNQLIKEFLVPESDDSEIYFDCLREAPNPYVGCIGFADFGQNLSVEFQFKRSEFEKWREMRRAALTLLTSFVKPNKQ